MRRPLITLIAFLGLVAPLLAWNNTGHFTVAKLGWDQLEVRDRQALVDLLKNHPHWDRYFAATVKPSAAGEAEYRFVLGSTWADWLRGFAKAPDEEGRSIYRFHVGARHYINWPFVHPRDKEMFTGPLGIPDTSENIILGLERAMRELRDPRRPASERAVALTWLLHLAGDIHQPLHNIALISKYSPKGDL